MFIIKKFSITIDNYICLIIWAYYLNLLLKIVRWSHLTAFSMAYLILFFYFLKCDYADWNSWCCKWHQQSITRYIFQFRNNNCHLIDHSFLLYFNTEHEVSLILNLYLNGYSIGKPSEVCLYRKNMMKLGVELTVLVWYYPDLIQYCQIDNCQTLLQDVKPLHPYDRASETLFSVCMIALKSVL